MSASAHNIVNWGAAPNPGILAPRRKTALHLARNIPAGGMVASEGRHKMGCADKRSSDELALKVARPPKSLAWRRR